MQSMGVISPLRRAPQARTIKQPDGGPERVKTGCDRGFKVDLVFEGSLSRAWGIKDALGAVLGVSDLAYGVLRLSSLQNDLHGKVLVSKSSHIVGARCNKSTDAYESLRLLLSLQQGNFAFLDLSAEPVDFDQSLFISIAAVLRRLPNLPDAASELFDQESLLDRVFGDSAQDRSEETEDSSAKMRVSSVFITEEIPLHGRGPISSSSEKSSSQAPITKWNVLEPFGKLPPANALELEKQTGEFLQSADGQRTSIVKLRAMPSDPSWQNLIKNPQQQIKWILSTLGFSLLLGLLCPLLFSTNRLASFGSLSPTIFQT